MANEIDRPRVVTLGDLLDSIEKLDPRATLYAPSDRPLSMGSPARVAIEGAAVPESFIYLLEVEIVRDVLETWSAHRAGRIPTTAERVVAVMYYADHDAYLLPSE